jgi:prepilin-type N-terminal cleavage/methylation domain-containing protein
MRRQAFTLVEMMVSLALVLFIMAILSQALSTGLETFRQLKGTAELDEKLRMASTILREDLKLDHFEGKRRLSDPSFWIQGPPREGFFHIEQGQPSTTEAVDGYGIPSVFATSHRLHFSIKLRGNRRGDFLSAIITDPHSPLLDPTVNTTFFGFAPDSRYQDTASAYNSQWAEVAYFLQPNGSAAGGTPLYGLYRRLRLAVPNNADLNWGPKRIPASKLTFYSAMSCGIGRDNTLYFNSPSDLTVPERRFGMAIPDPKNAIIVSNYTPLRTGEDLLLTDVLSFTVRVLLNQPSSSGSSFIDLPMPTVPPFGTLVGHNVLAPIGAFDTWSTLQDDTANYYGTSPPLQIGISALQITLRLYDLKTQQTRQMTIMQDM